MNKTLAKDNRKEVDHRINSDIFNKSRKLVNFNIKFIYRIKNITTFTM